ncbi:hypothetical protein ACH4U6_35320 [Streptomyces netropsis]|uniref:hypothetical protein n=1 Tax=Streptomyces netropsis TaxID=55404 RepID=UPI0037BBB76E
MSSSSEAGPNKAFRTREYGSMDKGKTAEFDTGTVLFDGLLSKHAACHIACWEVDNSPGDFYSEMARKLHIIAAELWKFSEIIESFPAGHWQNTIEWIQLVSFVGSLIAHLIEWLRNDDDLVQERTLIFDRAFLKTMAARPNPTNYFYFRGDGGIFHLHLKFSVTGDIRVLTTTSANGTSWSTDTPFPSGATVAAPAVAAAHGKLYCMVRSAAANGQFYLSRHTGTTWGTFTAVSGAASHAGPAMASDDIKIYAAYCHSQAQVSWSTYDGSRWASFTPFPAHMRTFSAPALALYDGRLHCTLRRAVHGFAGIYLDTSELYWSSFDGRNWSELTARPGQSSSVPALVAFGDKLFEVHRDTGVGKLYWATYNGSTWSAYQPFPSGASGAAPALAVHNGKLYCMVRSASINETLYYATFNGTTWSGFTALQATSATAPALTAFGGKLHCVNRG